ncbi:MAG: pantoate--beta-alanine ligase [Bacteroidota bacterium]|nr:pantoate--beta-alanine ligase [Bacteroidota bacterium]
MIIFRHAQDLQFHLEKLKSPEVTIGFVPTMGALHSGHLSLIEKCRKQARISVSSIFINPTQFNNPEDFNRYPVTIEKDILFLEEHGCDILFLPSEREIYPDESSKKKHYNLGYLETVLEGKFRPGHFQGVCLVVEKLLRIVDPDFLFIGQKDFQQCLVIKKLISLMQKDIKVIICPTYREKSGLAMSSRNLRLSVSEKELAAKLFQSLELIEKNLSPTNFVELKNKTILSLESAGFNIEYLEMAKVEGLQIINGPEDNEDIIVVIAAVLNGIRLIDNILISNN